MGAYIKAIAIVGGVAMMDPYHVEEECPAVRCVFCGRRWSTLDTPRTMPDPAPFDAEHDPSCLWTRARALVQAVGA